MVDDLPEVFPDRNGLLLLAENCSWSLSQNNCLFCCMAHTTLLKLDLASINLLNAFSFTDLSRQSLAVSQGLSVL